MSHDNAQLVIQPRSISDSESIDELESIITDRLIKYIETNIKCLEEIYNLDHMDTVDRNDSMVRYIEAVIFNSKLIKRLVSKIDPQRISPELARFNDFANAVCGIVITRHEEVAMDEQSVDSAFFALCEIPHPIENATF